MSSKRKFAFIKLARFSGLLSATALLLSVLPASAAYKLDVGDVLEISVARVPELLHRVPVQLDGTISFPALGTIKAAGLSPLEVQAKIQATLATRVFRVRMPDGREDSIIIEPNDVVATVVEYRPIYVNGDVSKPGEHPFRPQMTVRQAVALSGGYDVLHATMNNPYLEVADLRSELDSLWAEVAKSEMQVARLRAELDGKQNLDPGAVADSPLPRATIAEIVRLETEELKTRLADYEREKAYLQHSIDQMAAEAGVLAEQETKEEQGTEADADELKRATDLYSKGTLTSTRVTDARRAVLLSSTRKLQITAQLMQVRKQQDDFARQLERLDDQRKIKLLEELQDANVKLAQNRAKLEGVREKLEYSSQVRSQLTRATTGSPQITIMRKAEKGWDKSAVNEDYELQPGDVIEVALRFDRGDGTVTRLGNNADKASSP
ncbi:MAG: polysaccharide biosynthesis/export family protein [Hyphomicrobiales bacterium]|nr:polysaccharide biosynthesis/export family protein [Hyphomicrobiales bacterium]MBV9741727.1 polysaccharide biosynthesis/export family protein [Hyphomicrobiales bacterium]